MDHRGTLCPRNDSTWPPRMSPCSTVILMWDQHQRILSMPILSSLSAQICRQPSRNAQWQEPHCEDPTLSSDRAARWTAQQQGGTWYRCQQPDLTLRELVYVCVSVGERERVHSAKWLLGAHVLTAARVCVEMKINEWETWMCVCVDGSEGSVDVCQREHKLELLFTYYVCVCVPGYTVSFKFSTLVVPQL